MPSSEELYALWRNRGMEPLDVLEEGDDVNVDAPVNGEVKFIYYGNFCGPGTGVKEGVVPRDGLDLGCKLHDKFYTVLQSRNSDLALQDTADLLMRESLVSSDVLPYTRAMASPVFLGASRLWAEKFVTFPLLLSMILVLLSASYLGIFLAVRKGSLAQRK
jgi:hypothetical protein